MLFPLALWSPQDRWVIVGFYGETSVNCEGRKPLMSLWSSLSLHSSVRTPLMPLRSGPSLHCSVSSVERAGPFTVFGGTWAVTSKCPSRSSVPSQRLLLSLLPLCAAMGMGEKRWSNCRERGNSNRFFFTLGCDFFWCVRVNTVKICIGALTIRSLIKTESHHS